MAKFKDNEGREWVLSCNVNTAKAVREATDVNLFTILDKENVSKLFSDQITIVNVVYVMAREQCEKANVSDKQFGEALVGDAFGDAAEALMQAVVDFFPKDRRQVLTATVKKSKEIEQHLHKKTMDVLESLDVEKIISTGNAKPTEWAGPSASTQDR